MLGDMAKVKSLRSRLLSILEITPGLTDRELTDKIHGRGKPQQPINQLARSLEVQGLVLRRCRSDGLIGNYLTNAPIQELEVMPRSMVISGEKKLSEDAIKSHLKSWFEANGWIAEIAWGKAHGPDIICTQSGQRWVIEVKGLGSRNAMRVNYFLAILGELLQRMTDDAAKYSIALPDVPQFRKLWDRLPTLAKNRTKIFALFVSSNGAVRTMQ